MTLGLYKPGQGYWVRVLTATMIAVLSLAGAAWAAAQSTLVAESLPKTTWRATVATPKGAPAAGEPVELLGRPEQPGTPPPVIATATVRSFDAVSREIVIGGVKTTRDGLDVRGATRVRAAGSGFSADVSGRASGVPMIEPLILQGAAVGAVLLFAAVIAYYFTGLKRDSCEFLIATDMEMKKVNWSTRKHVIDSTWVVIGASVLIASCLFVVDLVFKTIFQQIGILVK